MSWVDVGQLPDPHSATLSVPFLKRAGGQIKKEKLVGWDKDGEITYQLPSRAAQTKLEEN